MEFHVPALLPSRTLVAPNNEADLLASSDDRNVVDEPAVTTRELEQLAATEAEGLAVLHNWISAHAL
jgi:hypothetical protein